MVATLPSSLYLVLNPVKFAFQSFDQFGCTFHVLRDPEVLQLLTDTAHDLGPDTAAGSIQLMGFFTEPSGVSAGNGRSQRAKVTGRVALKRFNQFSGGNKSLRQIARCGRRSEQGVGQTSEKPRLPHRFKAAFRNPGRPGFFRADLFIEPGE